MQNSQKSLHVKRVIKITASLNKQSFFALINDYNILDSLKRKPSLPPVCDT